MGKINSKQKGARGEREWAAYCREQGYDVRRTQQYCGNTGDAADCKGLPGIHIEVKRYKIFTDTDKMQALSQAIRDNGTGGDYPTVVHREDYGKWYVTMDAQDFAEMYAEASDSARNVDGVTQEIIPVTMLAEDWFKLYHEWESGKVLEKAQEVR